MKKLIGGRLMALALGLGVAAPAHADVVNDLEVSFCSALDYYDTEATLRQFGASGFAAGFDAHTIAMITYDAITNVCPQHYAAVMAVVNGSNGGGGQLA